MLRTGSIGDGDGYIWFEDVRVFLDGLRLMCAVGHYEMPLPVHVLHPSCTLSGDGDVGRLGVPRDWAMRCGLLVADPAGDAKHRARVAVEQARRATQDAREAKRRAEESVEDAHRRYDKARWR